MSKHFGLSYRRYNPAKIRYNLPKFEVQRLWFCRLLTMYLQQGAIVVNIDESSFHTHHAMMNRWQPKPYKEQYSD